MQQSLTMFKIDSGLKWQCGRTNHLSQPRTGTKILATGVEYDHRAWTGFDSRRYGPTDIIRHPLASISVRWRPQYACRSIPTRIRRLEGSTSSIGALFSRITKNLRWSSSSLVRHLVWDQGSQVESCLPINKKNHLFVSGYFYYRCNC